MKFLLVPITALTLMMSGMALAHCPQSDDIAEAAHALSDSAEHFHELIHDIQGYSHLAEHAHQFAGVSETFHEQIHATEMECRQIRRLFRGMEHSYYGLKRAFQQAHDVHHDPHAQEDFQEVVNDYHTLEHLVYSAH